MPFVTATSIADLPPGSAKLVALNDRKIALFNVGGSFYALDDTCSHRGGPLSEGAVSGMEVTCPWHGARFDLASGNNLCPPARNGVTSYKVQLVGNEVQVEVP